MFFPFLKGAGDCDVAMGVGDPVSRCWDNETGRVEQLELISGGFGAGEGAGGEIGCGDVAVACAGCAGSLC